MTEEEKIVSDKMNDILKKNGDLMGTAFENIFMGNDLEFSQQLVLCFNFFSCAIEAFNSSIQEAGVPGWNFEKMLIGIKRSHALSVEELKKQQEQSENK